MNYLRRITMVALVMSLSLVACKKTFAESYAEKMVADFNGLNNGQGLKFNFANSQYCMIDSADPSRIIDGELLVRNWDESSDFANTDAYRGNSPYNTTGMTTILPTEENALNSPQTVKYYSTFCALPEVIIPTDTPNYAKLNYVDGKSSNSDGVALTLGAATLYAKFASGQLTNYAYNGSVLERSQDAVALKNAIQYVMGYQSGINFLDMLDNKFFVGLLLENPSLSSWTASYDPGGSYTGILSEYLVFIMNVQFGDGADQWQGKQAQDLFYVAKYSDPPTVPEPASVLLWTLGGLGLVGRNVWRKRRSLK